MSGIWNLEFGIWNLFSFRIPSIILTFNLLAQNFKFQEIIFIFSARVQLSFWIINYEDQIK